jgi:hypothetical protein
MENRKVRDTIDDCTTDADQIATLLDEADESAMSGDLVKAQAELSALKLHAASLLALLKKDGY